MHDQRKQYAMNSILFSYHNHPFHKYESIYQLNYHILSLCHSR